MRRIYWYSEWNMDDNEHLNQILRERKIVFSVTDFLLFVLVDNDIRDNHVYVVREYVQLLQQMVDVALEAMIYNSNQIRNNVLRVNFLNLLP